MSRAALLSPFWRFQIAGWVAFAIVTLPVKLIAFPTLAAVVAMTLIREPLGFLLSCALRLYYRRLTGWSPKIVLVLIVGSAAAGVADAVIGRFVNAAIGHPEEPLLTFGIFCFRGTLYLSWSLLYFWLKAVRADRQRELSLAHAEASRHEAELRLLRAQVNPHFLFNALNTILATLEPNQTSSRRVVEGLATYLRYSLEHHHNKAVPLGAEYDATLSYLAVEQERFRGELIVDSRIDEAARHALVPGVLIQPLAENAVKYSRQTSEPPYRVRLDVTATAADRLTIEVANSGTWVEPSTTSGPHGTGLKNLSQRLALLYPERHRLETTAADGWVIVTVTLALKDVALPDEARVNTPEHNVPA